MSKETRWYTVKGLFRWYMKETGETAKFEERVVLFRADCSDQAIAMAEKEAVSYCKADQKANFIIENLNIWMGYVLDDEKLENGSEVYSNLTDSDLTAKQYIKKYYPKSGKRL